MTDSRGARRSTAFLILGAVLLWASLVIGGAARGILVPGPFARHLAASLSDPRVSGYLSARITDGIVAQRPNLVSVRVIIESAVNAMVSSSVFRAFVRTTAQAAHHSLFETAGKNVVLSLPDVSVLVRGALANASPELAAKIPPSIETVLASPEAQRAFARFIAMWSMLGRVLWAAWAGLVLGIVALVAAIWVAPHRGTALVRIGGALFAVGLALLAMLPAGRLVAAGITPDHDLRGLIHGVWRAYFQALVPAAAIACSTGIVLASGGSTMLEALDPLELARRCWRWLRTPHRTGENIARALVVLAIGSYAIIAPSTVGAGLIAIVGVLLVFLGLREVFRLMLVGVPGASVTGLDRTEARAWKVVAVVAAVLVILLAGTALLVFRAPPPPPEVVAAVTVCNGDARLCDRRIDQVVFPGAHNAMSNAEIPGWLFPHHNHAFPRQLADGIRALLIDVHYGVPAGEHVITDFTREGTSQEKIEQALGPEATAAAMRIRERFLGQESGPSGLYFCHGFCELGAYPVVPALQGVHEFLAANPGEVVIVVVEDYVTPEDLAQAFTDAGLLDLIYAGPLVQPLPTLRSLIDQGKPLLVFTESGKLGVTWLRPAFDEMQETPYSFHKPADFSCRPNRGGTAPPLFQINHWIETTPAPRPSNAQIVNAYDFLLKRARTCQVQRHRLPNIIAVDFYDVGDLFRVARTLNRLDDVTRVTRR